MTFSAGLQILQIIAASQSQTCGFQNLWSTLQLSLPKYCSLTRRDHMTDIHCQLKDFGGLLRLPSLLFILSTVQYSNNSNTVKYNYNLK